MKVSGFILSFFIVTLFLCGDDTLQSQIHRGEDFLKRQVIAKKDFMHCRSSGAVACPLYQTGQVFLAAFIIDALAEQLGPIKNILWDKIQQEQRNHSWGYAPQAPIDADDTAFALQALSKLKPGFKTKELKTYLDSLKHYFYVPAFAGYTTFLQQKNQLILPAIVPSTQNNSGLHPEVNANIAYLFYSTGYDAGNLNDFLLQFQANDGSWYSYFYPSRFYSTYFFTRYFCAIHSQDYAMRNTVNYIEQAQKLNGSFGESANPYATALATSTLLSCFKPRLQSSVNRAIFYLQQQQMVDGSWHADDEVIWSYHYADWPDAAWRAYDEQRVLTTALSVSTLKAYLRQLRS